MDEIKVKKEDVLETYESLLHDGLVDSARTVRTLFREAFEEEKQDLDCDYCKGTLHSGTNVLCKMHVNGLKKYFPEEEKYPCNKCGVLRTKAGGGTTFTVCDECWDKEWDLKYKKPKESELEKILEQLGLAKSGRLDIKQQIINLAKKKVDECKEYSDILGDTLIAKKDIKQKLDEM